MTVYESKTGVSPRARYIAVVGDYDDERVVYNEGHSLGCSILFDSRRFVMTKEELKANFERRGNDD